MLTNLCLCIYGNTFRVLHLINKDYKTFSRYILKPCFRLTKILQINCKNNFKAHWNKCFIIENNKK